MRTLISVRTHLYSTSLSSRFRFSIVSLNTTDNLQLLHRSNEPSIVKRKKKTTFQSFDESSPLQIPIPRFRVLSIHENREIERQVLRNLGKNFDNDPRVKFNQSLVPLYARQGCTRFGMQHEIQSAESSSPISLSESTIKSCVCSYAPRIDV